MQLVLLLAGMSPSGGQQSLYAYIKMSKLNKDQIRAIKNAAELDGLSMADRKTLRKMIEYEFDTIPYMSHADAPTKL